MPEQENAQHNTEDQNGKQELTCFVVIGFGKKTDYATGRVLNLDLTYTRLIKPAFDKVGIRCFRAIDVNVTGSIDRLMYHWIYHADFVIADLSTMNANVFYELGVRHAQRPNTTLIMIEDQAFAKLPFDLSHSIMYGYKHMGDKITDQEADRFVGLLSKQLQILIDNLKTPDASIIPVEEDSPVYTYLPGMKPPEWEDPVQKLKEQQEMIEKMRAELAAQATMQAALAAQKDSDTRPIIDAEAVKKQSMAIIIDSAEEAKNRKDFKTAIALFSAAAEKDKQDMFLWQRLALATYKDKEQNDEAVEAENKEAIEALEKAEQILKDHCELSVSTDPETLGLAGAINKRLYDRTEELIYFERAVFYYERGFYIKQDYYNGINAAFMYTVRAAELAEEGPDKHYAAIVYHGHANLIRKKVAEICQNLIDDDEGFAARGDQEWVYLTLYEAHFGRGEKDKAEALTTVIEETASEFALSSFRSQKEKLTDVMDRFNQNVQVPTGDGGTDLAPEPPKTDLPTPMEEPHPPAPPAAVPTVRQPPGEAIIIDLGPHRDKPVKSIEISCKVAFE